MMHSIKNFALNKKIQNFIKILIFILIISYLYFNVDFTTIFRNLSFNLKTFYLILFVFGIRTIVTILIVMRWFFLINLTTDNNISYKIITGPTIYSILASELFFFGFLSRSIISLTHNIKFSNVISSTIVEKFFSAYFMGILALASFIITFYFTSIFFFINEFIIYLVILVLIFSLIFPLFLFTIKRFKKFNFLLNFYIIKIFSYYTNWKDLYKPFIASSLIQLFNFFGLLAMPYIIGINFQFIEYALLLPIIIFLAAIPVSVTEWGWRELIFIIILQNTGMSNEESFGIGFITGVVYLLCTILHLIMYELFIKFYKLYDIKN